MKMISLKNLNVNISFEIKINKKYFKKITKFFSSGSNPNNLI